MELPPPTCYMKSVVTPQVEDAFKKISEVLLTCIDSFENQEALTMESYVLSRMLYKMNNQWRREKSLQGLKRINVCLNRYREMKVFEYMKELKEHFSCCNLYLGEIYLPTQQMIKYLLKQIMCIACLMSQLSRYCQYTYKYIGQHIAVGNFLPQNMVFLSMVSRIWTLSKSLILHSVEWYGDIYCIKDVFPKTKATTEDEDLPKNLTSFITFGNNGEQCTETDTVESNTITCIDMPLENCEDEDISDVKILSNNGMDTNAGTSDDKTLLNHTNCDTSLKTKVNKVAHSNENTPNSSDEDDLGCVVPRQELQSQAVRNVDKKLPDFTMEDDEDEDLGFEISRKEIKIQVQNNEIHENKKIDIDKFKQKIKCCKSFKKLKLLLNQLKNDSDHYVMFQKQFNSLKKEHLMVIQRAKEELWKFVELQNISTDDKQLDNNERFVGNNIDGNQSECMEEFECHNIPVENDFNMEDIIKKPRKNILILIEKHHGRNVCMRKDVKKRLKTCVLKIKILRKSYLEGNNRKQCIKRVKKEVKTLLATIV